VFIIVKVPYASVSVRGEAIQLNRVPKLRGFVYSIEGFSHSSSPKIFLRVFLRISDFQMFFHSVKDYWLVWDSSNTK
jgi:hypothetical protein